MKYSIGDKVRVKPNLRRYEQHGNSYVVEAHMRHCGEVMRVVEVFPSTEEYNLAGNREKVVFSESMLQDVQEAKSEVMTNPKSDPVAHPSHYTDGRIEVIDFIRDKKLDFCRGNVVKYICRAGKKGGKSKEIEDLKKARQYCEFAINQLEGRV